MQFRFSLIDAGTTNKNTERVRSEYFSVEIGWH